MELATKLHKEVDCIIKVKKIKRIMIKPRKAAEAIDDKVANGYFTRDIKRDVYKQFRIPARIIKKEIKQLNSFINRYVTGKHR